MIDLDSVQPFLFQGKAAMMLMGTFITAGFPPNVKPEMGYFQFPIIDSKVPTAEDGPVESLHIPSKAKNKADAHAFLAFVETPEIDHEAVSLAAFDDIRNLTINLHVF